MSFSATWKTQGCSGTNFGHLVSPGFKPFGAWRLMHKRKQLKINSTLKSFTLVCVGPVTTRSPKALK